MNWKNIIAFILGVALVMIYWKGCNPCPEVGETKLETETIYIQGKTVTVVDSSYYKKYHELLDQIPTEKPLYSGKVPKRIQNKIDKEDGKTPLGPIRRFETLIIDSTKECSIDGKIVSLVRGELLSTDFKYTTTSLVVKEKSSTQDTIIINNTITNSIINNHLWLSAGTSVNPALTQISVGLDFTHKKGWSVGYQFEKNFNWGESHNIRVAKTIW